MNTAAPDPLFVNSRLKGDVEIIELSTRPGDLAPPEELQRDTPQRRRRSDRLLARLPGLTVRAMLLGCALLLLVAPFVGVFK